MNMFSKILLMGMSGGLGAIVRYLMILLIHPRTGNLNALATLAVNTTACFLIGVFAGWLMVSPWSEKTKSIYALTLMTGFCGGFSTFSAFTLDCVRYFEAGQILTWAGIAALTVFGSILTCFTGYWMGQHLLS